MAIFKRAKVSSITLVDGLRVAVTILDEDVTTTRELAKDLKAESLALEAEATANSKQSDAIYQALDILTKAGVSI